MLHATSEYSSRNFDVLEHELTFGIEFGADFADLFEVRGRSAPAAVRCLPNAGRSHRSPCGTSVSLDWIDTYGDPDGDGFVEYHAATRERTHRHVALSSQKPTSKFATMAPK
jgi:hypothetical protein